MLEQCSDEFGSYGMTGNGAAVLLVPIYERSREGLNLFDVQAAKAIVDHIAE